LGWIHSSAWWVTKKTTVERAIFCYVLRNSDSYLDSVHKLNTFYQLCQDKIASRFYKTRLRRFKLPLSAENEPIRFLKNAG
jgi:hypothetical protein